MFATRGVPSAINVVISATHEIILVVHLRRPSRRSPCASMRLSTSFRLALLTLVLAVAALAVTSRLGRGRAAAPAVTTAPQAESQEVILTALAGDQPIDREIAALQSKVVSQPESNALVERLGWAFVTKARLSNDPGFYKLAELCASRVLASAPGEADALLLRGHIFHALHRFRDAEAVATDLTSKREFVFDYALLGDALMEQGKLPAAVEAYQKMVDLKPCLQTYSRIAHMRWLKGDLPGAIAAAELAVSSGSANEPEPLAWASTRLAFYLLQANDAAQALTTAQRALRIAPEYPAALLLEGRALLAQDQIPDAITPLKRASELSPLPDYLWTLADALRANHQDDEANTVEQKLRGTGEANDPRTLSLFLASRRLDNPTALRLANAELKDRQDVFTYDAVAWAAFAAGEIDIAQKNAALALAEGTKDPRILYHAGSIAAAAAKPLEALTLLNQAAAGAPALLPSERGDLALQVAAINSGASTISSR